VADVSSFGGFLKQYEIAFDPEKLRSLNTSISEVFSHWKKNIKIPGWRTSTKAVCLFHTK